MGLYVPLMGLYGALCVTAGSLWGSLCHLWGSMCHLWFSMGLYVPHIGLSVLLMGLYGALTKEMQAANRRIWALYGFSIGLLWGSYGARSAPPARSRAAAPAPGGRTPPLQTAMGEGSYGVMWGREWG